ncbi:MAG: hypothetical protein KF726_17375 [Anaerolineae bacterium]|nr:hypothetical protein [Anaerolineae bacterium]
MDTLKYLEPDFVRSFGTAISEFATVIGKKNFFTFGEVFDDDEKISHFVGRDVHNHGDLLGVDAALDFPLFFVLPGVIKGQKAPSDLVAMYENRQHTLAPIISAQGEIGSFFVNFLDNHDVNSRFYSAESDDPRKYDAHMSLALTCLLTLQGIPSLYYGTEQGLQGSGESSEATREALWGKPNAFDLHHPFYRTIELLSRLRARQPAIRYGRQYFRQTSEDGVNFSYATRPGGVLAYSRLLDSQEVVVIANTSLDQGWQGETLIDYAIEANNHAYTLQYSNQRVVQNSYPISMIGKNEGTIQITNLDGTNSKGATRAIRVELLPAEVQVWSKGR